MKGTQHKDPTTLAPIEGEASPFLFFFYLPEGKGKENKENKEQMGKGGSLDDGLWWVVSKLGRCVEWMTRR